MKKFLCAILFLTMVISLSACGGKGVSTLVKHYGQEKVDEMEIECTDETQLKVANDLIAEAKDIMSYCGSGDGTNTLLVAIFTSGSGSSFLSLKIR